VNVITRFARFWYDFIVGDDWTIAVAVIALVAVTAPIAHTGRLAWPIIPAGVAAILFASVVRVRRAHERATAAEARASDREREAGA